MTPKSSVITGGVPDKGTVRALVEEGKAYAIYVRGGGPANLEVELPAGSFSAQWLDVKSGKVAKEETLDHAGGNRTLASSDYQDDIALRIVRK